MKWLGLNKLHFCLNLFGGVKLTEMNKTFSLPHSWSVRDERSRSCRSTSHWWVFSYTLARTLITLMQSTLANNEFFLILSLNRRMIKESLPQTCLRNTSWRRPPLIWAAKPCGNSPSRPSITPSLPTPSSSSSETSGRSWSLRCSSDSCRETSSHNQIPQFSVTVTVTSDFLQTSVILINIIGIKSLLTKMMSVFCT